MAQSELRQDIVSGDWILVAPGRKNRPQQFINKDKPKRPSKKGCLFENPEKAGGGFPIIVSPPKESPWIQVVPNKFPAVTHEGIMSVVAKQGPFFVIPGVGHHDLIVTRDHNKNFPKLPLEEARLVMETFRRRYKMLMEDSYVAYISIFHNWGLNAGASIYHPHYQIITMPIIPPIIQHSLTGSAKYYRDNNRCVYCTAIKWEKSQKKRVIYENDEAIAFAPFVSHNPFEIKVFPKKHISFFEDTSPEVLGSVTEALHRSLKKIEKKLKYPDYNFFLNTAPTVGKDKNTHYHWHIEIKPKIQIEGGFELDTGIEINVVDPDTAAEFLRK
jgi:UDPglucose--hexose-1-phosphate uridylyltransferase